MPLIGDRGDKRYKRFVRERVDRFSRIYQEARDKYHLDISDRLCYEQAKEHAIAEADQHFQVFSDAFEGDNLLSFIASILGAVVSIASAVLAPVSMAASITSITLSTISSVTNIITTVATSIINTNAQNAMDFYNQTSQSLGLATNLAQGMQARHSSAHLLIYNPYGIFANGSIYKQENPGSLGAPANKAPNCMAGILGQVKPNMLSEQIQNSAHRHLAGNAQFDALNLPFPKAEFKLNPKRTLESLKAGIDSRMKELEEGFRELVANYFGAYDDNGLVEKLFNQHTKKYIVPKINNFNNHQFLLQNQYYRHGERLPLFNVRLEYPKNLESPGSPYRRKGAIKVVNPREWNDAWDHVYYIDLEGKVLAKVIINDDESIKAQTYPQERLAMALFERRQIATPPPKSQEVLEYLSSDHANLDVNEYYTLKKKFEDYILAYWGCFEVVVYGCVFDELRPYAKAKRVSVADMWPHFEVMDAQWKADYYLIGQWEKYAVGDFNKDYLNHDFNTFFFNSIAKEGETLSKEEQEKKDIFESFVLYNQFKEERGLIGG